MNISLTFLFAYVETQLGLQSSEVLVEEGSRWALICVWLQFIGLATYTIWARGVGPRFRPDQMSDLTWKDLLFFLVGLLVLLVVTFYMARCGVTLLVFCVLFFDTASQHSARTHFLRIRPFLCMSAGTACVLCWLYYG